MEVIRTNNATQPAGHYSQGIIHKGLVYVSGQLPIHAISGEKCLGTIEAQTKLVLENLDAILQASGSGLRFVLKTTVYVTEIGDWKAVNKVYARVFGNHQPTRSIVPVKELHFGYAIEIDAIAALADE